MWPLNIIQQFKQEYPVIFWIAVTIIILSIFVKFIRTLALMAILLWILYHVARMSDKILKYV